MSRKSKALKWLKAVLARGDEDELLFAIVCLDAAQSVGAGEAYYSAIVSDVAAKHPHLMPRTLRALRAA